MIEVAARQLLACGIWFAAYREAIGDPLPFMTGLPCTPQLHSASLVQYHLPVTTV